MNSSPKTRCAFRLKLGWMLELEAIIGAKINSCYGEVAGKELETWGQTNVFVQREQYIFQRILL